MIHNVLKVIAIVISFIILNHLANIKPEFWLDINWVIILLIDGVILIMFGFISYFILKGTLKQKLLLIMLVPILSNIYMTFFFETDAAFPYRHIVLIFPYVIVMSFGTFLGCMVEWARQEKGVKLRFHQ